MLFGDDVGVMSHTESLTHLGFSRNLKSYNSDEVSELQNCYSCQSVLRPGAGAIRPSRREWDLTPRFKETECRLYSRLIYGLEALVTNRDGKSGQSIQVITQISLLAFRDGTADEAVYIRFGLMPVEAKLHV